jgi:hypothetical protein
LFCNLHGGGTYLRQIKLFFPWAVHFFKMTTNGAAKRRRGDADTENPPTQLSEAVAELVDRLRAAMEEHDNAVGVCAKAQASYCVRDAFRLFRRMFPGFGEWDVVDAAKVVMHTLDKDPTGHATARVADGVMDVFTVYFGTY